MSDFLERAQAYAERTPGPDTFMEGVRWAAEQEPTEAEVLAATDAVLDWGPEDFNRLSHREICEGLARAALLAARDVRKGAK